MAAKRGLGKGLGSLIPDNYSKKSTIDEKSGQKESIVTTKKTDVLEKRNRNAENGMEDAKYVKITLVERNKEQPRAHFDEEALQELSESIKQFGVLQPLLVKQLDDHYIIIAGERRWRAARMAGLKEIPVIVRDYTEQEIMEISLIENIQREDLNVIEEALAYRRLLDEFGYRQEDLANRLSRSRTAITNRLRLLKLSPEVQEMLQRGEISEGHARAILSLNEEALQQQAAQTVLEQQLSVRETEKLVKKLLAPPKKIREKEWLTEDQFVYDQLVEDLRNRIGTKVEIRRQEKGKGKIVIDYYSTEELERIIELFGRHS